MKLIQLFTDSSGQHYGHVYGTARVFYDKPGMVLAHNGTIRRCTPEGESIPRVRMSKKDRQRAKHATN